MKRLQTFAFILLLVIVALQWLEQRKTLQAIETLTEIYCETTDAQECDREMPAVFEQL